MSFTYKGLEAQHKRHLVNGEEVAKQLERLRQQSVKTVAITDRPAQEGDELVLDYAGFIGDEQFQGGTAEKQNLTLGSGMFIPGFEEQLLGTVPGQDKTIHLSFPEDYHIPDLAGREARFDCHVHEIRLNTTYELNDEFAWSMGLANLKHLEEELANSMQAYADEMGELDLGDNLIRQAAQTLEIELDEETVERAIDSHMETLRSQLARQNLTLEMFCEFTGKKEEELRKDARGEAEQNVRIKAAVAEIARLENLTIADEEMADALNAICKQNKITMEQLTEVYDPEFEEAVVQSLLARKAMELIRQHAKITVVVE